MTGPDRSPTPARRMRAAADWLMRWGAPGAFFAFLLLRIEGIAPLLLLQAKSAKAFPVLVLACAEMSWLFGGPVGLLLAFQWLVHELAHLHAAQRIGLKPGWRGLVPFIGVYLGTRPAQFGNRENEALVALSGVLSGLVVASLLYGYGQLIESASMVLAAKLGFGLNLINLLPFRPFDGGRIFPGALWRYAGDSAEADSMGDAASRRFVAGCRHVMQRLRGTPANRPQETRVVLGEALTLSVLALAVGAAVAGLILPPLVFALALLAGMAGIWCFIAALVALDPRAVAAPASGGLQPRRAPVIAPPVDAPLPWRNARSARTALCIYAICAMSLGLGAYMA